MFSVKSHDNYNFPTIFYRHIFITRVTLNCFNNIFYYITHIIYPICTILNYDTKTYWNIYHHHALQNLIKTLRGI